MIDRKPILPVVGACEVRLNSKGRAVASKSKTGRGVATVPILLLVPQVKQPSLCGLRRAMKKKLTGGDVRYSQFPRHLRC